MQGHRSYGWAATAVAFGVSLLTAQIALASPGDLDPTFSGDGIARLSVPDGSQRGTAVAPAPDGGVVAGGSRVLGGDFDPALRAGVVTRFREDGSVDDSFGRDGSALIEAPPGFELTDLAVQADGAIVVVGFAQGRVSFGPLPGVVARLTPDGELDSSFAGDGMARFDFPAFTAVRIDPQGRIVAAGARVTDGTLGAGAIAVLRLLPDGSPDPAYSEDGYAVADVAHGLERGRQFEPIVDLAIDPLGRAVIGTGTADISGDVLFRFTADGDLDGGFGSGGRVVLPLGEERSFPVLGVAGDGRLLAARDNNAGWTPTANSVYELGADGELDPQRSTRLGDLDPIDMAVAGNGFALLAGTRTDSDRSEWDLGVAAVGAGPALPSEFGAGGIATARIDAGRDEATAIALDPSERVLVAGWVQRTAREFDMVVARLETAPGPPDADGDSLGDTEDRCPERWGPREDDGCPTARRKIQLRVNSIVDGDAGHQVVVFAGSIRTRSNTFCAKAGAIHVMRARKGRDVREAFLQRKDDFSPVDAPLADVTEYRLEGRGRTSTRDLYARVGRSFSKEDGACAPARAPLRFP